MTASDARSHASANDASSKIEVTVGSSRRQSGFQHQSCATGFHDSVSSEPVGGSPDYPPPSFGSFGS
jgi:hypothetical protein